MNKKSQNLLITLLFIFTGCISPANSALIKEPPTDLFVKIFKQLEIKICSKKEKNKCEIKKLQSTGSGLIIKISKNKEVVLTAGHVCNSKDQISFENFKNNKEISYSWIEFITVLDRNKRIHQGHVILDTHLSDGFPDLCALYVPSLKYLSKNSNIEISKKAPKIGEEVIYIGAPLGIYHPPTALILKGIFSGNIDKNAALISAPSAPGASGSVILSKDFKIYGVLFAVHPDFNSATIITSFEETKKFLEKVKSAMGD